jgi:hypothetical protein
VQPSVTYAEPPHLFRGLPGGRFEETTGTAGADFARPMVARGAAYADIDGDGDLDVACSTNGGSAMLWRNDGGSGNGWIRLRLQSAGLNRDAIGARVRLTFDGRTRERTVRSAASYASQSEMPLTFGLGAAGRAAGAVTSAEVRWPDGSVETFPGLPAGKLSVLKQTAVKHASR